ncbi:MAG: AAA domain-containing protein [Nitrosopumilaceae archaeon]|nr:AAA domain-containing protein [Nitrosopumilaceae archaeon]NIU86789.1 AAA domain-containing protein [Nitrosopumilaceae archaeon]NIX60989.1 AAA domain-containing protein [Nitrosopumilaceae archaeon]
MDIIQKYIEQKDFKSKKTAQPYKSVLNEYVKIRKMVPNESPQGLFDRLVIGKSSSMAQFSRSVINDFLRFEAVQNTQGYEPIDEAQYKQDEQTSEEEIQRLKQIEEEQKLHDAIKRLEKANEQMKIQQRRQERLKKQEFNPESIPDYIVRFDYLKNIPKEAKPYYAQGNEEKLLKMCHALNKHVILSGKAGSGKTELVIKLAKETETPIFKFSCSSDVRMSDLIGSKTISEDGQTVKFEAGMLLKAVLTANEYGKAIILLDEINTLAEKVQKNINGLADGTGFIDLPQGRVKINPGTQFMIAGTMNLSYAGTNPLNPELKDRFNIIAMPEMSRETRHKIYSKFAVPKEVENKLMSLSRQIETAQRDNRIAGDVVFSTRSQIAFLELYEELEANGSKNPAKEALDLTLVAKFDDEDDQEQIQQIIGGIF